MAGNAVIRAGNDIRKGFSSMADGIMLAGKWRQVFDTFRDALRYLESKGNKFQEWNNFSWEVYGQMKTSAKTLDLFERWPWAKDRDYRAKYLPRAKKIAKEVHVWRKRRLEDDKGREESEETE